jgi:hypothetical protein
MELGPNLVPFLAKKNPSFCLALKLKPNYNSTLFLFIATEFLLTLREV